MEAAPTPPVPGMAGNPSRVALAQHHQANLVELARIPYDPEYIAPQEILRILRYCYVYNVDFTQGLEPRRRRTTTKIDR